MLTLNQLTGEQLDRLALRLMAKTKDRIEAGLDHQRVHDINVRKFIPHYVRFNQSHDRRFA